MNRETLHRMTGLLWIEAINSNPNGNPDQDNDPRRRADGFGEISPVSLKHKVRALIADKEGPVWQEISEELGIHLKTLATMTYWSKKTQSGRKLTN